MLPFQCCRSRCVTYKHGLLWFIASNSNFFLNKIKILWLFQLYRKWQKSIQFQSISSSNISMYTHNTSHTFQPKNFKFIYACIQQLYPLSPLRWINFDNFSRRLQICTQNRMAHTILTKIGCYNLQLHVLPNRMNFPCTLCIDLYRTVCGRKNRVKEVYRIWNW